MQRMNRGLLFILFLGSALYLPIGCKKDHDPKPEPGPTAKKLVKIQEGTEDYINFSYGSNGNLSSVSASWPGLGIGPFSLTLTYNSNNQVDEVINNSGVRTKYFYDNGQLQKTEKKNNAGDITWVRSFFYENKKLIRLVESIPYPAGNQVQLTPVYEIRYTYYTAHPNDVREAIHYELNSDNGQLEKSLIYKYESYDDKKNPYSLLGDFGLGFFRHSAVANPSSEALYDKDYILEGTNENEYTYDADGYPTHHNQRLTRNGTTFIKTFKYTYN